jgi:hypothetical protein
MKIRFFSYAQPEPRKNRPPISLIPHDLASAYTLPTPPQSQASLPGHREEVKAP